jgi:hypothetical protein
VFAAKACTWLARAKAECCGVADEHQVALHEVTAEEKGGDMEVDVRRRLMLVTGGEHSVTIPSGHGTYKADIVTDTHLIEVKRAKDITRVAHAIGQCSWYSAFFPNKKARVHLFGSTEEVEVCQACQHLAGVASRNNVEMTFEII